MLTLFQSIPLLTAMQGQRQFCVYRKADKHPVNPLSGYESDAQNPLNWLEASEAVLWADQLGPGYGVGLVLHEGSGLFCVDVDHCINAAGEWSDVALMLAAEFAGAGVEVSLSGTGIHIFGRARGEIPPHSCRNKTLGAELYTGQRYIALTGTGYAGDAHSDHTEALHALIARHFPPTAATVEGDWTDGPCDDWSGPANDDELIATALRARSAKSIFGRGAEFGDLWRADPEVMMRCFPPSNGVKEFNASSADMALASHLAFWTGRDCERMVRLMNRSALRREKWERDDYLRGTILKVCANKTVVYTARGGAPSIAAPPTVPRPPPADLAVGPVQVRTNVAGFGVGSYLTTGQVIEAFKGYVYVEDLHVIYVTGEGTMLSPQQMNSRFGGLTFQMTPDGSKPTKNAWDAFVNSEVVAFPKVRGLFFDPRRPSGELIDRESMLFLNSWVQINVPKREGDVSRYLEHLKRVFPRGDDAEILNSYFKFVVQYPGVKAKWAPLLQGVEGNGKSFLSEVLKYCVGKRYYHSAKASQIDSRFNANLCDKLLVIVEDIKVSEDRGAVWEALKPMITETELEIESKGLDKVMRDVCFNFVFNSNHKNAIRKTLNDRRIAPFFSAQQHAIHLTRDGLTPEYFHELFTWLEAGGLQALAHYLSTSPIPDQWNPATRCMRAPRTSSTDEAVVWGQGTAEQDVADAIAQDAPGFANGWICGNAVDRLLESTGKAKFVSRVKRGQMIEDFGYIKHPGLSHGRSPTLVDGTRPILYIQHGHITEDERDPQRVVDRYLADQRPEARPPPPPPAQ